MMGDGYSLDQLQGLSSDSSYYQTQVSVMDIRLKAVQEAAESLGMQAGLYDKSQEINKILDGKASTLDQVFNFNLLVYREHVLPPVIEHAGASLNLGPGATTLRINGETYNVIRQVKFVTTPPNWRDYLWMKYTKPDLPNRVLLPRNDAERKTWKKFVDQGWQEGEDQGITIFKMNLSHLETDYNGMVLYKSLLLEGMVSPFYVSSQDNGITGDKNHLVINDQSMAITTFPELQLHSQLWDPVITNQAYDISKLPPPPPPSPVVIHPDLPTAPSEKTSTHLEPPLDHAPNHAPNHAPIVTAVPIMVTPAVNDVSAPIENIGTMGAISNSPAPIVTAKPQGH